MAARRLSLALCVLAALAAATATAAPVPYAWACTSVWRPTGPPTSVCADSSCNPVQANLRGDVLVLNTGSMDYTHGGFNPTGSDPAACCALCRGTDGCNAWVFCNQRGGCGAPGSCSAYVTALSDAARSSAAQGSLPAAGFGNFGACSANGTWPYGMCSLKRVPDSTNPQAFSRAAAGDEGWISGVVPKPSTRGCPPTLTPKSCAACAASRAPSVCYECALGTTGHRAWRASVNVCVECANGGGKC